MTDAAQGTAATQRASASALWWIVMTTEFGLGLIAVWIWLLEPPIQLFGELAARDVGQCIVGLMVAVWCFGKVAMLAAQRRG